MRNVATSLWRIFGGVMLSVAFLAPPAFAREIKGLTVATGPTGTRAEILLDVPAEYALLTLSGPDRLVVDLDGVALPPGLAVPAGQGLVRAVRTGHPVPGKTRIVFDLAAAVAAALLNGNAKDAAPPVDPAAASAAATARLVAQLPNVQRPVDRPVATPPATTPPAATATVQVPATVATGDPAPVRPVTQPPVAAAPPPRQDPAKPTRPLIIAIDAGHGGQDPGAIGKGGRREKDVTLAISRELARQINATPGLKAYLGRDSDVFIPLYKRARLARDADADIFVSIHADAAENRSADGSSVYVLSLKGASSQRARWLADKENAADLIGGVQVAQPSNTLNAVLLDLTQSGNMRASEDAGAQVLSSLQQVGNMHKRTVERANFAVLRTADMPAMLVETAFISNAEEERRLGDPAFQRKLADAVLKGINTYFERQPPPGTLYAQRAAQQGGSGVGIGIAAGSH